MGKKKKQINNSEYINNPYIDEQLLADTHNDNENDNDSLFNLLKSNPKPNLLDDGTSSFAMDAIQSSISSITKQLCPHCTNDDTLMDREEFEIHIAIKHPKLMNESLTQTIMASFNNPSILNNGNNNKKLKSKKKKRRKLSQSNSDNKKQCKIIQSKTQKWNCEICTFTNTNAKRRCMMCQTPKSETLKPN